MARYLVTGGAGFIGSHVVDALLDDGHSVRVVDDLSSGSLANVPTAEKCEFINRDLAEPGVAESVVDGVTLVIHLAAIPSVPRSVLEPARSHRANVEATHALLLAAREAGIQRVVQASSSSVYGESEELPKTEAMRVQPMSPYGLHKLIGEQYNMLFNRLYGLETVSLRFFNVFGPRQSPTSQYSGVISLFIESLLSGTAPTIYGDGEQTRDFTYVSDVSQAILNACVFPNVAGRVVNVARGGRTSINALYGMLQKITGVMVSAQHGDERAGDIRHSQADVTLAQQLLGFVPNVSIEKGLIRTVEWQRSMR
jgi:UDP-glucose 4-epimerase